MNYVFDNFIALDKGISHTPSAKSIIERSHNPLTSPAFHKNPVAKNPAVRKRTSDLMNLAPGNLASVQFFLFASRFAVETKKKDEDDDV